MVEPAGPLRYVSTRGGGVPRRFTEILLEGLAPDGGLYVPETVPVVGPDELEAWRDLGYPALAVEIIRRFADDIPHEALALMIEATYDAARFGSPEITPLLPLEPGLALLRLSNGPTLAFKDIALQLLGRLFEWALARRGERLNILGATSGDTGSAAEHAMLGRQGIRVFMLSPHGRMSPFQRAQMYGLDDPAIFNIAIEGTFDDCQALVKTVSADADFKRRHRIGTVNSINWARLAAQIVYYFKGWFAATRAGAEAISFAVPTGNFGNICAGHVARSMGLPIRRLVLATNENDGLDRFFRTGRHAPEARARATSSPSMDIAIASNFERFLFDLVGRDPAACRRLVEAGAFDLAATPWHDKLAGFGFVSGRSTHADRIRTIRRAWTDWGVELDPHSADAVGVAGRHRQKGETLLCLETALPAKFEAVMTEALGRKPARPAGFDGIEDRPQHVTKMPPDLGRLEDFIATHDRG